MPSGEAQKVLGLRYDDSLPAPFIVARGKGEIAGKILELAEEYGIPIHSEESIVDALFTLEIGSVIPEDFYEIIADIFVHVCNIQEGL